MNECTNDILLNLQDSPDSLDDQFAASKCHIKMEDSDDISRVDIFSCKMAGCTAINSVLSWFDEDKEEGGSRVSIRGECKMIKTPSRDGVYAWLCHE